MEFKNLEKFRSFLDANLKQPYGCYDFDNCLKDFERQIESTGSTYYELSGCETVSGKPEIISFERVDHFFVDEKEVPSCDDFDYVETTIIF